MRLRRVISRKLHLIMSASSPIITVVWMILLNIGGTKSRSEEYVITHKDYLGQYFAGHSEFPWLVEIRSIDSEVWHKQENWTLGNLIGPRHVLTTCSAVATFETIGQVVKSRRIVKPKDHTSFKVMYSPDNPYHGPWWYITRFAKWRKYETKLKSGFRTVSKMMPHPYCNPITFKFFFGMLELDSEPIEPFRNFINYAPADLDRNSLYKRWYRLKHKSVWVGALVATTGKVVNDSYSKYNMLHNYKIRYQVKYTEWSVCEKHAAKMGWSNWNTGLLYDSNAYCLQLYDPDYSLGVICQHDQGAPIVWEDVFVGIVVTGATYKYCSNLDPLPFVAVSLDDALLYWTNVQRNILAYYLTDKTNLFPGLANLYVQPDDSRSESPTVTSFESVVVLVATFIVFVF